MSETCTIINCNRIPVLTLDLMGLKFYYCKRHKFFGDKMLRIRKSKFRPSDANINEAFNNKVMEEVNPKHIRI